MVKKVLQVLVIYIVLTVITTVAMHDFSPRHTLFLLADALLLTIGESLVKDKWQYYKGIGAFLLCSCSVFIIRYLTPTELKVWDVDIYISFCLALGNIILLSASLLPKAPYRFFLIFLAGALVFLPVLSCWGYFVSESAFLTVDALMAVLQTNAAEALSYVKDRTGGAALILVVLYIMLLAVLGTLCKKAEVKKRSWKIIAGIIVYLILNGVLLFRTGDNFMTSIYAETRNYQENYEEFNRQKEARKQYLADSMLSADTGKPGAYVLVIGESQNPTRMSAYGYTLKTTPWLESMKQDNNMLLFRHAYACQVQTVPALTYALTAKNQYNSMKLEKAVSLIDVAKAAGYRTVWLSNQVRFGSWGTPVTVIAEEADQKIWTNSHQGNTLDTEYYDGELVNRLRNIKRSDKMLIVVHLMGNHISYHSRYPAEFETFKGEGRRSEYDNSILYNDFVMKTLFETVSAWPEFRGLVYFSDHGEGVNYGEAHNPDNFIFDMAYIPLYVYLSSAYRQKNPEVYDNLRAGREKYFTNDLVFNTMLGIMGIQNDQIYEKENDLTSVNYNGDKNRFKTLYGKKSISEDVSKP